MPPAGAGGHFPFNAAPHHTLVVLKYNTMLSAPLPVFPRMGQVLLVDAPWIFKAPWQVIKPLLRKYQALVRFVTSEQLAAEFFTPETLPADFRGA